MFTDGYEKTAAKVKKKSEQRPDPNARPHLLYPAVPENFDGWPDKTAQPVNFKGIRIPGTTSVPKVPSLQPAMRTAPPRQPHMAATKVGLPQAQTQPSMKPLPTAPHASAIGKPPGALPPGVSVKDQFGRMKTGAVGSQFAKPPQLGLPKAWPIGKPITPKPRNPIYTPAAHLKDEFGKVKDLPANIPMPTKVAAAKPVFGKMKAKPLLSTLREAFVGPQLQTEPLGATMPNQGTGGGITGGYGSN